MSADPMPIETAAGYSQLIEILDLKAKVALLTGASMVAMRSEEAAGLHEVRLSDGPTGVRGLRFTGDDAVALFPNATLLASSWSEDTLYEVGRLLAEEALARRIHLVLGPTINLHRSVLGGRLFEAYSEDPFLSGRLGAAYVRGLQAQGVGACLKHLVANEAETQRHAVDNVLDEATLREVYLLPFELAVQDADPWSIMAAYNGVNGTPCTEHDQLLNQIVKREWGYSGLVMSDFWATKSASPSANGGLDLVMPGPAGPWGEALVDAVADGEVAESVVDDHLRRLLRLADRVGELGTHRAFPTGLPAPDSPIRRERLTRLAAQGMTVLRNEGGVLPLANDATVALVGRHAVDTVGMGGGSAQVCPPYQVSIDEGLRRQLGAAVTVVDGVEVRTRPVPARPDVVRHPLTGEPGVQAVLLRADGSVIEQRHARSATTMVGIDDDLSEPVAVIRLRARVTRGGRMLLGGFGVGRWEVRVGDRAAGGFDVRLSGTDTGEAVLRPPAGTLEAEVAPGDIVETTVDLRQVSGAVRGRMPGAGLFGLVARPVPGHPEEAIAAAVEAARAAEVAVVAVGLTEEQETEAVDKTTIRLPGNQDDLVRAVAAAARRTVVVVNSATPVLMPWLAEVDAVLVAGLPGQEGGHAVAAALLGDIEPAGRLVTTWPAADGAAPAWSVTPVDGRLVYQEGRFLGYRGHDAGMAPAPAFWFGHGLGYGTWEYADPRIVQPTEVPGVAVTVTNTGDRTSREVVQLYLRPADPQQPVRLIGWRAVTVGPGASVGVEVAADPRMWRRWDVAAGAWARLPQTGQLLIARGLGDVRARLTLG